jgi:hypothetical protein
MSNLNCYHTVIENRKHLATLQKFTLTECCPKSPSVHATGS